MSILRMSIDSFSLLSNSFCRHFIHKTATTKRAVTQCVALVHIKTILSEIKNKHTLTKRQSNVRNVIIQTI